MESKQPVILVVEDDDDIRELVAFSLEDEGYRVEQAADGLRGLELAGELQPDLLILDLMLPGRDGLSVCRELNRRASDTPPSPVLMLTARGEEMDRIIGFEYGADDYMTKPFNILEVKARIKSIFRRAGAQQQEAAPQALVVRNMAINLNNRSVTIDQKDVNLTAKEFDLLQLFVSNRGKVFSRENLLETIWKYDYLGDLRTVDVHIRRLREKIEHNPAQPEFIYTKWGVGYYFTDKD